MGAGWACAARAGAEHRAEVVLAAGGSTRILAGGQVTATGVVGTWAYRSVDGGRTWAASLTPSVPQHAMDGAGVRRALGGLWKARRA